MARPCAVVVVDTTELFRNPLLVTGRWKELLARSKRGRVDVVVPLVVLRESARHFDRQMRRDLADAVKTFGRLRDFDMTTAPDLGEWKPAKSFDDLYVAQITRRIVGNGGRVATMPVISHDQVLARDLAGKKPFNASGKGYRDTLIWETLLSLLVDLDIDDRVLFVTSNSSDFCDPGGQLAAELAKEVASVKTASVEVVPSIAEVLNRLQSCFDDFEQRQDDDFTRHFREESLDDIVSSHLLSRVEELIGETIVDARATELTPSGAIAVQDIVPREVENVTIEDVEVNESSIEYSIYEHYEGDTVAITASVEVLVMLDGYLHKSDIGLVDDGIVEVIDNDWNDHLMRVELSARLRLSFDLLVVGSEVENIEFDSAERIEL